MSAVQPIPHPPRLPLLGNLPQVIGEKIVQELMVLAQQYGPIYELVIPGTRFHVVSSLELAQEVCDEKRFHKAIHGALDEVRRFTGDGLFTAYPGEANWSKAHNILLPGFGLKQMKEYLPKMVEIAQQLLQKWQVVGEQGIDVSGDYTRLTLDTIALCGFNYRFRSFGSESLHPFLEAMVFGLQNSMERIKKTKLQKALDKKSDRQFNAGRDLMFRVVDELLAERQKNKTAFDGKVDFLSLMMDGIDKKTGTKLDLENIRYQLITFLIAGHETTSGMLSFTTYFLVNNPEIMQKAVAEVDRVLGNDPDYQPTFKDVGELDYINRILKESLRLWPTAPAFARTPYENTIIGGRYEIKASEEVLVLLPSLHRDPAVWKNPETFDPDRFLPGKAEKIPEHAWRPFGTGARSCIGQHFAMVEATVALAMILKHFTLKGDPDYKLQVKETLSLKPEDFRIRAFPRLPLHRPPVAIKKDERTVVLASPEEQEVTLPLHGTALAIYYGSNMGSSEELAHRLAKQGRRLGFVAHVASLDEAVDALPNSGIVLIVTATYNGMPPDNAQHFAQWIKSDKFQLNGLRYAVLGCGNTQWKTFQVFPREVDRIFAEKGGKRLIVPGEADANSDFEGGCETFTRKFWTESFEDLGMEMPQHFPMKSQQRRYQVQVVQHSPLRPLHASFGAKSFRVTVNRELQKVQDESAERSTRHIEVHLPEGITYKVGDHFGVFAHNREPIIEDIAHRLGFATDTMVTLELQKNENGFLPTGRPVALGKLLREYIELQEVATRRSLEILSSYCLVQEDRQTLTNWAQDTPAGQIAFLQEVLNKRASVYDILCRFPSCHLPLDAFLELASPIRPRYYSISSSPLAHPRSLSLTVGVVSGPSLAQNGTFKGVCSSYLQSRDIGDSIFGFVKAPTQSFCLPDDPLQPIIMVGPGTGFAPFRGFLQERLVLKNRGQSIGPALLFFGCRKAENDFIYRQEMEDFHQQAVAELHVAFSHDEKNPLRYVQDHIWEQRDRVWEILQKNARVFVCGDGIHMAPDVRRMFLKVHKDKTKGTDPSAELWLKNLEDKQVYLVDVFGQKKT